MESIPAKKLTIFTSEEKRLDGRPLYSAVVDELRQRGISQVLVTKGIAGYGQAGRIRTTKIEVLSYNLPITIEATDTAEKIDSAIAIIAEMVEGGVVEVMQTRLVRG